MAIFTQNSDLRKTGIYGWTLPAHWVTLGNGDRFNTCPNAGACAGFCYAKTGTFKFSNVLKAHIEKLEKVLYDRETWLTEIYTELAKKKYKGKYIRIHDAGDFFSIAYAQDWLNIAKDHPHTTFYTYTKEVGMFKYQLDGQVPSNFIVIYSFGGKQDKLINKDTDRHSDVFTNYEEMISEGYNDIAEDDKQAAINPNHRVGLYRNNIKHLIKKQGNKRFSEWQK